METRTIVAIFAAGLGGAIAREMVWKYYGKTGWKARRRSLPADVRNSGFWTDRKLIAAEIVVWGIPIASVLFGFWLVQGLTSGIGTLSATIKPPA